MLKFRLTLFLFWLSVSYSLAQITFTFQDIGNAGTKVEYKNFQGTVPLGNTGADQTWDYSNQNVLPITDTAEFMSPGATPYAPSFPQANIAIDEGGLLSYYRKANNGFFLEGIAVDVGGIINTTPVFRLSPSMRIIQFPSSFGSSFNLNSSSRFTFRYDTVVTVSILGAPVTVTVDSVRIVATFSGNSAMNGWGTLILPPGISYGALRQQVNQTTTFSVEVRALTILGPRWIAFPISLPRLTNNSIRYWTNGKSNSMLEITLDSANSPVRARFQPPTITSVENSLFGSIDEGIFPNPFLDHLQISNMLKSESAKLTNLSGKMVAYSTKPLFDSFQVGKLETGLYIQEIFDESGLVKRRTKVMKK